MHREIWTRCDIHVRARAQGVRRDRLVISPTNVRLTGYSIYYRCVSLCLFVRCVRTGQVFAWGHGGNGRLGTGNREHQLEPFQVVKEVDVNIGWDLTDGHVSCGDYHTLAVTELGRVYSWGCGAMGQVGFTTHTCGNVGNLVL